MHLLCNYEKISSNSVVLLDNCFVRLLKNFHEFSARVKWTTKELEEIQTYFGEHIASERNVKEKEARVAIKKSKQQGGQLHRRRWDIIKKKVNYIIMKNKKD